MIHGLDLNPYSFVAKYYFASILSSTYGGLICSIGNHTDWRIVKVNDNVLPSVVRRPTRRHRKQRVPSIGELAKHSKSNRCKRASHNKRTCKLQPI